jgi:hypothetical protein
VDKLPSAAASLPVGPGAYGFFDGMQFANVFSFAEYRARLARHQSPMWRGHRFAPDDLMRRDVMFAFKNSPYLDHRLFQDAYGIPPVAAFPDVFEVLHRLGLVDVSDSAGRSTLTGKGRLCVEEIACLLRSSALTRIDAVGAGTPATVAASRSAAAATRELRLLRKHHFAPTYPALGKRPASGGKIS